MSDICRNEEWLAAYLDGRLTETERNIFEMHLSRCPHCLAELIAAKAELDEMSSERPSTLASLPFRVMRHGSEARPASPLRLVSLLLSRPLSGRPGVRPLAAVLSLVSIIMCVGAYLLIVRVAVPHRDFESARSEVARILATADMGHMRLSGGPARPPTRRFVYRSGEAIPADAFGRTEQNLKAAISKHRSDWRFYSLLADLYMADNQIERAEIHYAQALARKPGDPRLLSDRAAAQYRLGRFDLSLRNLESALAADSTRLEALYNIAVLYREMGDPVNAKRHVDSYLRKDPDSPWAERARILDGD